MPWALPRLNALVAFEATARHQSFTRAATELNLTQTAIRHRIGELGSLLCEAVPARAESDAAGPALGQIAAPTQASPPTRTRT